MYIDWLEPISGSYGSIVPRPIVGPGLLLLTENPFVPWGMGLGLGVGVVVGVGSTGAGVGVGFRCRLRPSPRPFIKPLELIAITGTTTKSATSKDVISR